MTFSLAWQVLGTAQPLERSFAGSFQQVESRFVTTRRFTAQLVQLRRSGVGAKERGCLEVTHAE